MFSMQNDKATLRVFDMSGRIIKMEKWNFPKGISEGQIRLSKGSYVVKFTSENNETWVRKIMIK